MAKEKGKKPKMIKVDKDFLFKVLEAVENLTKEVNLMKQDGFTKKEELPPVKSILPERDYIFQCMETQSIDRVPPSPQDIVRYRQRSGEFRKKLETLMRENKVVQITAMFLKKL